MKEFLKTLLTKENVSLALSIFASLGTVITFLNSCLAKRKNLIIRINSAAHNSILQKYIINLSFENRSQLPIAITAVAAKLGNEELPIVSYPYYVGHADFSDKGIVVDRKFTYNLNFPVDIPQLSGASGHILFEYVLTNLQTPSTPLILTIHSTRGRTQQIELKPDLIKYF